MRKKTTYAVFGLGRYGTAVARELSESGMDLMAVDIDQRIINDAAAYLPVCKCADVTDPEVIDRLGIAGIDTVIICMAGNLEATVMAVTLCREAGVRCIIAKCASEMHRKILLRVGADQVVFPESESGLRLARNLLCSGFIDRISLSRDVAMAEIEVRDEWFGKNLIELNLRKKYGLNVVGIKKGEDVSVDIVPEQVLEPDMTLIVIAHTAKLNKLN